MMRFWKAALFSLSATLVLAALASQAQAQRCCRSCAGFCAVSLDPSGVCCTGPLGDGSCGVTTCGAYLG